ncbi:MAG: hypothetical protein ACT4PM_01250 [Gemmatimonadales bacterium]
MPNLLLAQSRAGGRVVRLAEGDTLPVGRVAVVLHRVGASAQGPIDTVTSDARGRFAVRFRADSGAIYLLSVRYRDIEYFSQPVSPDPGRPDTGLVLVVADTSSAALIRVPERTILVARPDQSGSRTVIDWIVLANPGERTRVPADSVPSWGMPLPPEAQNVELAEAHLSQFSPDALEFRRDSVLVFAPLSPGRKELVLQYRVPAGERALTIPLPASDSVFLLLEESDASVVGPGLTRGTPQRVEDRVFQRWAGAGAGDPAEPIEVRFPSPGLARGTVLALVLVAAGLGFAALAIVQLRGRGPGLAPELHPVALADAIARLDTHYLAPGASFPSDELERYRMQRAALKQRLERALASARRGS